jgi:metal-sulfur cluster biosynthetic enzyme
MPTKDEVIEVLKDIQDPELFIDIWTLGLIYEIDIEAPLLKIKMTFTSAGCPAGQYLVDQVREKTVELEGIDKTEVEIVFTPPWEPSEELKAMMGIG